MKKLKWGLIGCGDIVQKRVGPAFIELKNCNLIAVSRANKNLVKECAEKLKAKKWYYNWEDIVKDKEIDAVYIATPVYLHADQTIACAKAGKHVLCEKPMAMNTKECNKMIAVCKKNNVKLSIAYYRHFYPVISRIKEIISSGIIGEITFCQINAFEIFNRSQDEPRYWLLEKSKSGGGPMMDFGCHRIEVLLNILGPIKNIKSIKSNVLFKNRNVEDTLSILLKFKNQAHGIINVSHAVFESNDTLEIYGSKGSIHVPILNKGKLTLITDKGAQTEKLLPHKNFHLPHINAFTEAILNKKNVPVSGEIGLEVNKILEKIYK